MKKLSILLFTFGAIPVFVFAQTTPSFVSNLFQGLKSTEVTSLQQHLLDLGYLPKTQTPTGFFGALTKKAVQDFQTANGITATGFVGPATRKVLNSGNAAAGSAVKNTLGDAGSQCLAAATRVQDAAKLAAAKVRDAALAKSTAALISAKTGAAGIRDGVFMKVRNITNVAQSTAAIQAAIDTYNAAVQPAVVTDANNQKAAQATYATAVAKAVAAYKVACLPK